MRKFGRILILLSVAVAPGAPAQPLAQTDPAGESALSEAEDFSHRLEELERSHTELRRELEQAKDTANRAHAQAIAEGRLYVRMARAGLLAVGGGFEALSAYASRLERLRASIARAQSTERQQTE